MNRLLLPLIASLAATPAFAQPDLAGDWSGTIEAGGQQLTLIVHLTPADGGAYAVTMDVPAQGAYGFPADSVAVAGDTLTFTFSNLNASFEGVATEGAAAIEGAWRQGGRDFPLTLAPYEAPAEEADAAPKPGPKPGPKPARGDLSGEWIGTIEMPGGGTVRFTLHLTRTGDGYEAALTAPGGQRLSLERVTVDGRSVSISNTAPPIGIVGTVSEDETTLEGEWQQGGQKVPVTFTRG